MNEQRYEAAAHFWRARCEKILSDYRQIPLWQPWLGIHQQEKTLPIEEGAIYSLYSATQNKALNIEQYNPTSNSIEISAFVDTFGEGALEHPIPYLSISCALSEESAKVAEWLIVSWIEEKPPFSATRALIDELIR